MFRSLRVRNYRLYFTGNVISQVGTWMNRVAQDWLVLQLTHDDPVALGIATGLQFGPILLLSVWAGILADRYDKRKMLLWIQLVLGLSGVALGVLAWAGSAQIWHVYVACVVVGSAAALDGPVRQSFVVEIVGPRDLTNAVGLNSLGFNGARIVGPAVAGVLIALVNTGPVMVIAGLSYLAVIVGLKRMRTAELHPAKPVARAKGQARAGFAYVRGRPDLVLVLTMLFLVATFGMNFQLTLAIIARIVFQRDASSYGLLTTALAVGALLGALISARRTRPPRLRLLVGTALAFGVTEIILGLTGSYLLLAALLVPQGVFMLMFVNAANAMVQLTTPAEMRGRVMGIYTLVFLGGTPFISPLLGVVAERFGGGAPLIVGGVISAVGAIVLGGWIARTSRVHVELRVHPVPHVHVVNPEVDNPDDEHLSQSIATSMERMANSARRTLQAPARAARRVVGRGSAHRPGTRRGHGVATSRAGRPRPTRANQVRTSRSRTGQPKTSRNRSA
jgi:MFS family permease